MQAILWNNQGARLLQLGDLESSVVWIHCHALKLLEVGKATVV
jgi:hypothetical protein